VNYRGCTASGLVKAVPRDSCVHKGIIHNIGGEICELQRLCSLSGLVKAIPRDTCVHRGIIYNIGGKI